MTRYRVEWDPRVDADFINLWIGSDSATRQLLTHIADWIDKELASDPESKGEYQPDFEVRTLAIPATSTARVSVAFRVFRDDRIVRVLQLTIKSSV